MTGLAPPLVDLLGGYPVMGCQADLRHSWQSQLSGGWPINGESSSEEQQTAKSRPGERSGHRETGANIRESPTKHTDTGPHPIEVQTGGRELKPQEPALLP